MPCHATPISSAPIHLALFWATSCSNTRRTSCTVTTSTFRSGARTSLSWCSAFERLYRWQYTLLDPDVHQWLHGLHVLLVEQTVEPSDIDEMDKAGVQVARHAKLPKVEPVLPEEMCIAAEHLLIHVLDLVLEALWEAGGLAAPVVRVHHHGFGVWDLGCGGELVADEDFRVLNLAIDPGLDVFDVHWCRQVDRIAFGVDPGVGSAKRQGQQAWCFRRLHACHLRAGCHSWTGPLVARWTA